MFVVSNMAVFCSSLISCFPGMLLRYFLNDFDIYYYYYYYYYYCYYYMEYVDSKVDALTQIVRTHQHKLNSVTDNYVPEERITGRKKSNKGHCCCRGCCCNAFVRQVWSIP